MGMCMLSLDVSMKENIDFAGENTKSFSYR